MQRAGPKLQSGSGAVLLRCSVHVCSHCRYDERASFQEISRSQQEGEQHCASFQRPQQSASMHVALRQHVHLHSAMGDPVVTAGCVTSQEH